MRRWAWRTTSLRWRMPPLHSVRSPFPVPLGLTVTRAAENLLDLGRRPPSALSPICGPLAVAAHSPNFTTGKVPNQIAANDVVVPPHKLRGLPLSSSPGMEHNSDSLYERMPPWATAETKSRQQPAYYHTEPLLQAPPCRMQPQPQYQPKLPPESTMSPLLSAPPSARPSSSGCGVRIAILTAQTPPCLTPRTSFTSTPRPLPPPPLAWDPSPHLRPPRPLHRDRLLALPDLANADAACAWQEVTALTLATDVVPATTRASSFLSSPSTCSARPATCRPRRQCPAPLQGAGGSAPLRLRSHARRPSGPCTSAT